MTIYGLDLPPGVLAERGIGGHRQRLIDRGYGARWECDCAEYRTVKPNTARAYCRHTQRCAGAKESGIQALNDR